MNQIRPRISVILPVRNAATTLRPTLQSIAAQTLPDWELLVIDDHSTDNTPLIVSEFAANDPRIRVQTSPGHGIVAALNQGIASARADLVARMDADDLCHPTRLERQAAHLDQHPEIGLVSCRVAFGGDRRRARGYALHVDWLNSIVTPEQVTRNRFVESPFAHPSVMFRRSLTAEHGGYRDGPFPEDYELWLRWLDHGVSMGKVNETLFTWTDPPDRLSRTDPRYSAEAFYRIKAIFLARALKRSLHGRTVWIWGAGRPTRKRARHLEAHGIDIHGYIDIDPAKQNRPVNGRPVIAPENLPSPRAATVISYVANRGARDPIRAHLVGGDFVEGADFWMAA